MGKLEERSLRRVLVANRGEIAVRVMRTLRERGIESVAVYSDADRKSAHVLMADHAVRLGPPPAGESYLLGDKVIAACAELGVDAVHPGYGFLSENAAFAEACVDAGIVFIGPSPESMRLMGSKTRARESMEQAAVPTVPGNNGASGRGFPSAEAAAAAAGEIGYPVLIKASAGGGGKGMRLVAAEAQFVSAFEGARREASSAFGDDTVYVEKAIIRPRHVEIQVFADTHGNVVHLGERDCSVQRRHQKVIEEAPCPVLSATLRESMGRSAVDAARAVDYVGAGTVEFLLDGDNYYFLEMNTRLQVEHPITEILYGVDLVGWQLDVAEGRALPLTQAELDGRRRGVAMECRVYAEDPEHFLPSPGTIKRLQVPDGPYVRNDSGVYEGAEISVYYDPLLSKLVVWGNDRAEALARMRRALDEYSVSGIRTNLALHRRIFRERDFVAGHYDTSYIEGHRSELCGPAEPSGRAEVAVVVAAALRAGGSGATTVGPNEDVSANGRSLTMWRSAGRTWRRT